MALGLVSPETSQTLSSEIEVNPKISRARRLRKAVVTAARLLREGAQMGGFRGYLAMITLTYGGGEFVAWSPLHIAAFLDSVRKWYARRGLEFRYVWAAELGDETGRMHYHVLIWVPHRRMLPKPDRQGWWKHGMSKIEKARHPGYLVKYASKGIDSPYSFPKGARVHGAGGLTKENRRERRWWLAPAWVRKEWPEVESRDLMRAKGGGWVDRATGEYLEARYSFAGFTPGGGIRIVVNARAGDEK